VTVADVYRALWRHKLFIVVLTASLAAATGFLTSRETPVYEASTLVRVQQRINSPGEAFGALQTAGRLAQTYAQIASTATIAQKVQDTLGGRVPLGEIAGSISARQIQDLELLSIGARSTSPARAQAIANAAPQALRSFIEETGTIRDQIITVQPAALPTNPVSPTLKLNIGLAIMLGLIFNGALAVLIEILGDRASEPGELERLTGLPVLAVVPKLVLVSARDLASILPADGELRPLEFGRPKRA
jgi:capsular polysaccharide biosynthesis protein